MTRLSSCCLWLAAIAALPHCVGPSDVDPVASQLTLRYTGTCNFSGNTLTLTLNGNDSVIVGRRGSDGALLVNLAPCGTATHANTKVVSIVEATPGPETVVLDYANGPFGWGSATPSDGTTVDLGGDANDEVNIRMGAGNQSVVFGSAGLNFNADAYKDVLLGAAVRNIVLTLSSGNDTFSAAGDANTGSALAYPVIVYGGDGNDTLRGGDGNDILSGNNGHDILHAEVSPAGGADSFIGGNGNDTVTYAARSNDVTAGMGSQASGEAGEGDSIDDSVDILIGGNGNDTLSGSPNSLLFKTLVGGPGDDRFLQHNASGADSHDILVGGAGNDTADYSVRTVPVVATLDGIAANDGSGGENDNINSSVEDIVTGSGNDTITGSSAANLIAGGAGVNVLNGGDGDDTFDQGNDANNAGIDIIDGGNGIDTVDYSQRQNALSLVINGLPHSGDVTHGESDTLKLTVENLTAGSGNDALTGSSLDNTLDGGPGSDALHCLAGSDIAANGETYDADCELTLP